MTTTLLSNHLPKLFPRHVAIAVLVCVASLFAGNHIAARIAFDDGTGLLLAILTRSGLALVVLIAIVTSQREAIELPAGGRRWQLLLGLLVALQSLCLYSAVARIPVAVALLVSNTFPILLVLLSWALGGPRPELRAALIMGLILIGLVFVLDVPVWLSNPDAMGPQWLSGIAFAFCAAAAFACALWITDHKLSRMRGSVRSMLTIMVVFTSMLVAGVSGLIPGGMALPASSDGWIALMALALLYGVAFTLLFISVPRLNMARNAPVMNIEPVASLVFGWLILEQILGQGQLLGGAIVLGGIVLLSLHRGS